MQGELLCSDWTWVAYLQETWHRKQWEAAAKGHNLALTLTIHGSICILKLCLLVHHTAGASVRATRISVLQMSVLFAFLQGTRQRKQREAEVKERKKAEAAAKKDGPAKVDGTATPGEGQTPPGEDEGDANDDEDGEDKNDGGCSQSLPHSSESSVAVWLSPGVADLRPSWSQNMRWR